MPIGPHQYTRFDRTNTANEALKRQGYDINDAIHAVRNHHHTRTGKRSGQTFYVGPTANGHREIEVLIQQVTEEVALIITVRGTGG